MIAIGTTTISEDEEEVVPSTPISSCSTISTPGDYILTESFGDSGECIIIAADNVSIDGDGHILMGNINANNGIAAYTGLSISNINMVGNVTATCDYNPNGAGCHGGSVTITNSTNIATVDVSGGYGAGIDAGVDQKGGDGGSVTITNSSITTVNSNGGYASLWGAGGAGGTVAFTNSSVGTVSAYGGEPGAMEGHGPGGDGGDVTFDVCPTPAPTVTVAGGTGGASGTITPSNCHQ